MPFRKNKSRMSWLYNIVKSNSEKIEAMASTNKYPGVTIDDLLKDFLCSPLNRLPQWEDIIKWSSACSNAFELLKAALINSPVLSYLSQDETFILDCDASGNIIVQYSHKYTETLKKVISYASRSSTKSEKTIVHRKRRYWSLQSSVIIY